MYFGKDMEQASMKENQAQFSQCLATGMPFTQNLLLSDFGYLTVGKKAWKVLKGENLPPPGTDPYVVKFLSFLKIYEDIKKVPLVSTVLWMDAFQHW